MASSLINAILFLSLVVTSICVLALYRRLKLLSRYHEDYGRMIEKSVAALGNSREAVALLSSDSKAILLALGAKVDEAKALLSDFDARSQEGELRPAATGSVARRLSPQDLAHQAPTPSLFP